MKATATQQTVALVQRRLGIAVDGIFGPQSQRALSHAGFDGTLEQAVEQVLPWFSADGRGDPDWGRIYQRTYGPGAVKIHGVAGVSGMFLPRGVVVHHSGGPLRDEPPIERFIEGRPDLRGPLAQMVVARSGMIHFVTNGRAHHAGSGDEDVLEAVMRDEPLPAPDRDTTFGNSHFLGVELDHPGDHTPFAPEQLKSAYRLIGLLCASHRWGTRRVIGHKEWTRRKVDPALQMDAFRAELEAYTGHPPKLSLEMLAAQLHEQQRLIRDLQARLSALESSSKTS